MTANFSESDMQRISRVVRRVEREAVNDPLPGQSSNQMRTAEVHVVRTTSTSQTAGRYPGKIVLFDSGAGTDTDLADCWLVEANGNPLTVGKYLARRVADQNGRPVFRTVSPGGGGATLPIATTDITFSGAKVYHNTTQTIAIGGAQVAFNSEYFDTDTYHDNSTNNSRLTIPTTGYYHFGGSVYIANGAQTTGERLIVRLNGTTFVISTNKLVDISGGYLSSSPNLTINGMDHFTAGDYLELRVEWSGPGSQTVLSAGGGGLPEYNMFWIFRLGK